VGVNMSTTDAQRSTATTGNGAIMKDAATTEIPGASWV
jgi:hypothetical protein